MISPRIPEYSCIREPEKETRKRHGDRKAQRLEHLVEISVREGASETNERE